MNRREFLKGLAATGASVAVLQADLAAAVESVNNPATEISAHIKTNNSNNILKHFRVISEYDICTDKYITRYDSVSEVLNKHIRFSVDERIVNKELIIDEINQYLRKNNLSIKTFKPLPVPPGYKAVVV